MTEKKPQLSDKELALLRALTVYRKISEIENLEVVLKEAYAHWHRLSEDAHVNARGSGGYLTGRADSWQELIELIHQAKRHGKEVE